MIPTRRAVLAMMVGTLAITGRQSLASTKLPDAIDDWRFREPVTISADDIAWFRTCRAEWNGCESGAPAIVVDGIDTFDFDPELERDAPGADRLERVLCAFFLHARFPPGRYRLAHAKDGPTEVTVTDQHFRLLREADWRTATMDCKRPYGDFTYYQADMARILGLPVTADAEGKATLRDADEERLSLLHNEMQWVVQAFIEHAELTPGRWFIPYEGWDNGLMLRGTPVSDVAIARYRKDMEAIAEKARNEPDNDLFSARGNAVRALYALP